MNANQLINEALKLAQQLGYQVRHEYLGGHGTGYCQVGEQPSILLDVGQPTDEQLDRVAEAINAAEASNAAIGKQALACSAELRERLEVVA